MPQSSPKMKRMLGRSAAGAGWLEKAASARARTTLSRRLVFMLDWFFMVEKSRKIARMRKGLADTPRDCMMRGGSALLRLWGAKSHTEAQRHGDTEELNTKSTKQAGERGGWRA